MVSKKGETKIMVSKVLMSLIDSVVVSAKYDTHIVHTMKVSNLYKSKKKVNE